MSTNKKAFSLTELLIIILILGALAYISVPRMNLAGIKRQKADTVTRKIITDLRLARRLAISYAATNVTGYSLNMTGGSPYTGYDIVNLSTSEVLDSHSIDSEIVCTGGSNFKFGPLGNLLSDSDTQLLVSSGGKEYTVNIVSASGAVEFSEN